MAVATPALLRTNLVSREHINLLQNPPPTWTPSFNLSLGENKPYPNQTVICSFWRIPCLNAHLHTDWYQSIQTAITKSHRLDGLHDTASSHCSRDQ